MNKLLINLFLGGIILAGCGSENNDSCQPRPCVIPNINQVLTLTLDLNRYDEEILSSVRIARLNLDNVPIDTLILDLSTAKLIKIPSSKDLGFTMEIYGSQAHFEAELGFLITFEKSTDHHLISAIIIDDISNPQACECSEFLLKSLKHNSETIQINSKEYTLAL
jgi:hypothetical protein